MCLEKGSGLSVYKAAGPAYYVLHPQKGITICVFLTDQVFKNREGIVSQTNLAWLSDLRFDTYEWKQTKIWMIYLLRSGGVLILNCGVLFYFNHIW